MDNRSVGAALRRLIAMTGRGSASVCHAATAFPSAQRIRTAKSLHVPHVDHAIERLSRDSSRRSTRSEGKARARQYWPRDVVTSSARERHPPLVIEPSTAWCASMRRISECSSVGQLSAAGRACAGPTAITISRPGPRRRQSPTLSAGGGLSAWCASIGLEKTLLNRGMVHAQLFGEHRCKRLDCVRLQQGNPTGFQG